MAYKVVKLPYAGDLIEWDNKKYWRLNGRWHRIDYNIQYIKPLDTNKSYWFINGKQYTEKEYEIIIQCPWMIE